MKNKKILVLVIILVTLVVVTGGVFAYLYFATDYLRSNQQLFEKYGSNVVKAVGNYFDNEDLKAYADKKNSTPYNNEGTINSNKESDTTKNEANIVSFMGSTDNQNKKAVQNINVLYSDSQNLQFSYLRNNDQYGITSPEIVNKYIVLQNKNLKEFATKLGIQDVKDIPDTIDLDKKIEFSKEEIEQLESKYIGMVKTSVTEKNFSQDKSKKQYGYVLTLEKDDLKAVESNILNTLKSEDIIKNKLTNSDSYTSELDNLIQEIQESDYSDRYVKITAYEVLNNKKILKIETKDTTVVISYADENEITVEITTKNSIKTLDNYEGTSVSIPNDNNSTDNDEDKTRNFKLTLTKEISDNSNSHKVEIAVVSNDDPMNFSIQYKVSGMNSDTTTEEITLVGDLDKQKQTLSYSNNVKFTNAVTIPELNANNSVLLNDYDATNLYALIQALILQTNQVNEQKLTQAGPNSAMYNLIPNSGLVTNNTSLINQNYDQSVNQNNTNNAQSIDQNQQQTTGTMTTDHVN